MAIVSEKAQSTYEEPTQKKKKIKRITEMKEDLHNAASYQFKHKSKKKDPIIKKEEPECDDIVAGGLSLKNKLKEEDLSGKPVVLEYYNPELNALESVRKKYKTKQAKKKKQKNISSELITEDPEEDQGIFTNKMSNNISDRMLHQFKHKSKKKDSVVKREKPECDEGLTGGLHLKNKLKEEDFSAKPVVLEYYDSVLNALESMRKKDKPKNAKKKKQKNISSELITEDHEDDQEIFTNKISKVILKKEGERAVAKGHEPVQLIKSKKDKETKKKKMKTKKKEKLCQDEEGKCSSLTEISERMTVDQAQDSEMKCVKKKSKKAAGSRDGMATSDGVLGANNQMDEGKEMRHKKRKRRVTDELGKCSSLKEISERMTVDQAQDSEMKCDKKKSKKTAGSRDGMATSDGVLGANNQTDEGKEMRHKKRKRRVTDELGKCSSLKEISERMTVDQAQDSEMKCDKKKSKKAAGSRDGMATSDGVLGANNQKDEGKEMRHKKRKRHVINEAGKCSSLKEISERMTVNQAQDSEIKCGKKAAGSRDGMAISDGILGANNQTDEGKEMRHKKRKRRVTDIMDETNALKTKKQRKEVVEEESATEGLEHPVSPPDVCRLS
uniref:Lysine-rich nucleolar protein 1 isoform X2 n=1 Tax=Geotrypetes seraphini TaxID=260995 RepID=A0A6P8SIP1_GEOSA|nr:lysine-rich nucleolar protein 1 isoform X2 [Geotrypetes seraphini]